MALIVPFHRVSIHRAKGGPGRQKTAALCEKAGVRGHEQLQEKPMRVLLSGLILSTLVVMAGCGADAHAGQREQELERQLAEVRATMQQMELERQLELALTREASTQPVQLDDFAPEQGAPAVQAAAAAPRPAARPRSTASQPVGRPAAGPVYSPAPRGEPRVVTTTTVKRDAAIGAGVGAVAGAVIHKPNRVKGAVVGGVVGAAAGAVVGSTVNRRTTVVYD
jgi:hypothetical protein